MFALNLYLYRRIPLYSLWRNPGYALNLYLYALDLYVYHAGSPSTASVYALNL